MSRTVSKPVGKLILMTLILALTATACAPNIDRLKDRGNVEKLIKALSYERDPEVRADAARALGELGALEALDPLITLLSDDEEVAVRSAAAEALGQIDGTRVIEPLIDALEDSSAVVRDSAETGLILCSEEAIDPMMALLESDDAKLHQSAVNVLAGIGSPAAMTLIDVLNNRDEQLRTGAYDALVQMGSPAVPDLTDTLSEGKRALSQKIVNVLVDIGSDAVHPLISLLNNKESIVINWASDALIQIEEPAIEPLINMLVDDVRRVHVQSILLEIGEPAVAPLINALSEPDLQQLAGDVLIAMGNPAVDPLLEAYHAHPEDVERFLHPLVYGLAVDNLFTRDDVEDALITIGEPSIPYIIELARNSNLVIIGEQTFIASESVYGPYGSVEGMLVSGGLCTEPGNWEGRIVLCERGDNYFYEKTENVEAGGGIGVVHYNNIAENLYPTLLEDNESSIVSVGVSQEIGETLLDDFIGETIRISSKDLSNAQDVLEKFGDAAIPYLVEYIKEEEARWSSSFYNVRDVLIDMGSIAVPAVIEMLNDADSDIRYIAAYILGQIDDDRCVEALIGALGDTDSWVRWNAAYSLGDSQAVEAIEPLVELLDDAEDFVQEAAVDALAKIGIPAVDHLLAIYHDESSQNKDSVESALLAIFKANQASIEFVASKVCSGQAQINTSEYSRYEGDYHPTVILDDDGDVHSWTYELPVDWLPYTPEMLELVVCLGDLEKNSIQVCPYYKPGTYIYFFSITRYRYKMDAALYSSFTGNQLASTSLWGSYPDACPYSAYSSQSQITGSTIGISELATWLSVYGIPLPK